jgi:rubrerythrin
VLILELKDSRTKENLLKAFAGESQARNRYEYAAGVAKKEGFYIVQDLFYYTADQEKEHGKVFYNKLKEFNGQNIEISGAYPIGNYDDTLSLLKSAKHNEEVEYSNIYTTFAKVANEEGFTDIGTIFSNIASIEKVHSNKFNKFVKYMEEGSLFKEENTTEWMCTNCGYIYEGKEPPQVCPVCEHPQGYFIRLSETEFNVENK